MASVRIVEFRGFKLCLNDQTYEPSDDTDILLNLLKVGKGEKVLDMGSGSGILGIWSLIMGGKVMFVDINPYATTSTLCSLKVNNLYNSSNYLGVLNCDLLSCLRKYDFDVAIFNPPYLPVEEYNEWIGYSWSGGKDGSKVLVDFLKTVKANRIYTLYSSLSDEDRILYAINKGRFKISQKYEKVIGYERLIGLELVKEDDKGSFSRA
ncbi:HemK2/MTQ2 family protein methyltransferase [Saccharolobus islandicus]|uniref:Methylase n=1 Tax=Saccharolobus islandicus (strain L.D.8.5 / Lassen \|nr:HemK2/MTQ2 family protein methyltransferase [Sulfolobus islandicus]ADB87265.1 putative methylase [Sulfolobus islandicus L.D.8.5]